MSKTGVKVELVGRDGNAFAVMGRATAAMRRAGVSREQIDEYRREATSGDYDNLLAVTLEWVDEASGDEDEPYGAINDPPDPDEDDDEYLEPDEAPEVTR